MEIYSVASRLNDMEERMKKNIIDFSAASTRKWAEDKERIDEKYSLEMEKFRMGLAARTESKILKLKASLKKSVTKRKSAQTRKYSNTARKTIEEVLSL